MPNWNEDNFIPEGPSSLNINNRRTRRNSRGRNLKTLAALAATHRYGIEPLPDNVQTVIMEYLSGMKTKADIRHPRKLLQKIKMLKNVKEAAKTRNQRIERRIMKKIMNNTRKHIQTHGHMTRAQANRILENAYDSIPTF
jgi:vacuolar-type H+-ATPase subunit H